MSGSGPAFANPDQALIHRFLNGGGDPLSMDSNPLARALHAELHAVDREHGRIIVEFTPDLLFIQGTGVIQGGAVSAMLDFAMAFAVLAQVPVGTSCATVNMATSFQRAAPQGRYRAVGEIERCGKTLAFASAKLTRCGEDERMVATATSTLALV